MHQVTDRILACICTIDINKITAITKRNMQFFLRVPEYILGPACMPVVFFGDENHIPVRHFLSLFTFLHDIGIQQRSIKPGAMWVSGLFISLKFHIKAPASKALHENIQSDAPVAQWGNLYLAFDINDSIFIFTENRTQAGGTGLSGLVCCICIAGSSGVLYRAFRASYSAWEIYALSRRKAIRKGDSPQRC